MAPRQQLATASVRRNRLSCLLSHSFCVLHGAGEFARTLVVGQFVDVLNDSLNEGREYVSEERDYSSGRRQALMLAQRRGS